MIKLALRGMAERRLRSALTAVAVLLGVAMVSGTYIETDQIRTAFEDITEEGVKGIDVIVTPREAFSGQPSAEQPTLDGGLVQRVQAVRGVEAAEGQITAPGNIVVDGEVVETFGAPGLVVGDASERFDPSEVVEGRDPERSGEASLLEQNAEDQGVEVGDRIGIATRRGLSEVEVVGIIAFGEGGSSLGGTTVVELTTPEVQRLFDRRGELSSISVIAEPATDGSALRDRVAEVMPPEVRVQTAAENAEESAEEINDQIGSFLTPVLLTLAGAAVLVGAFIIFNTFSITVAQRAREFAMLRALGASRRQVLGAVTGEALLIGILATAAGIAAGIGFARLLNTLFDAAGFGIPRSGLVLAPRTIAIALVIGIGVTLVGAFVPALRATRVAPVVAMSGVEVRTPARSRRIRAAVAALFFAGGIALTALGLFGSGPATGKLVAVAGGAVAIFVGVALLARYLVRPLAGLVGYPLERAFRTPGRLARENALRNPARTAITSAALMVGVGLVVFVAVFAAGLKSSFTSQIDELVRADIFIYGQNFQPFPGRTREVVEGVPGVETAVPTLYDQLQVNGQSSNAVYDYLLGMDPERLAEVYAFEWLEGDDSLLAELGRDEALIEEQFAKAHGLEVGDSYEVVTPSGGEATLRAVGRYRDPTILQGSIATLETLGAISPNRDPIILLTAVADSADAEQVQEAVKAALEQFPTAEVESRGEYKETIEGQLNQIVYLLYALLAMSVVISLFGIANSLFLSIHERTAELGVLRAVGGSRRQVRRMIRYESVITSVIGALLGTAIGLLFAWLVTRSLSELDLELSIPVGQLVIFMVLAVVVGVIGAIVPARRGSRMDVLEALQYE